MMGLFFIYITRKNIMATEKLTLQEKLDASKVPTTENKKEEEVHPPEDLGDVTLTGNYKALRLRSFCKRAGQVVKPNADGLYIPSDEEEFNMLEYYANQAIAYVERV
jgi:hypothetical protein